MEPLMIMGIQRSAKNSAVELLLQFLFCRYTPARSQIEPKAKNAITILLVPLGREVGNCRSGKERDYSPSRDIFGTWICDPKD